METVQIKLYSQPIFYMDRNESVKKKILLVDSTGFMLKHNTKTYLIGLHGNVPIQKVTFDESNTPLEIIVDSCWSPLLILNTSYYDLSRFKIFTEFQNKFPKQDDILTIDNHNLTYLGEIFFKTNNTVLPYIKAKFIEHVNPEQYIGYPVTINNKLVGQVYSFENQEQTCLIIPTYVIIKHFTKNNNFIYKLPMDNIKKINSSCVNDNKVYHRTLNLNIPTETFAFLDGDINKKAVYVLDDEQVVELDYLKEENDSSLLFNPEDKSYLINQRLIELMIKMNYKALENYDFEEVISSNKKIVFRDSESGFVFV